MKKILLYIASALSATAVVCAQSFNGSGIRVFPAENQSVAGVFLVSHWNGLHQPQYAFNTSEARRMCGSLGVSIASKAQVKEALDRGLETCRYGWTDENLAVIPRSKALASCGQNKTGLVTWRAAVTQKFDVFCFNETDAAAQLRTTTTDSLFSSSDFPEQTHSSSTVASPTRNMPPSSSLTPFPSSSSSPADSEVESALFVGSTKGSFGAKAILITSACVLLLVAVVILAFLKLRRRHVMSADMKQPQEESIQIEEWTCGGNGQETKTDPQEDERIEVGGTCQTDVQG
ncbi:lymphatic vessel endothelial hyaluronic acid receptor 1a [Takifugu rubripes]|uniref:Eukaryotic translation initiation factor 4, gamma 2a n=1 Tax=Takifugu rubripes TaxID=31033 RepID=A0A674NU43_TAKRU|nr:lymphatic vessel endothelial hyaluronic acid receptor 1 [Takifugu rubripes]